MNRSGIVFVIGRLLCACSTTQEPTTPPMDQSASEAGGPETTIDGSQPVTHPRESPCGGATVAMINTGPDSSIIFCVDPKRGESIGEIAPLGALSKLRAMSIDYRHACASEVFRALAPEHAVPQRLLDSCAAHPVESRSRAVTSEIAPPEETTFTSSYCGSAGAANFQAEQCSQTSCLQGTLCSRFCITDLWGWHDRALTWQLGGEEGNWGEDHVASCNGNTRFRAFWRDDVGDAWVNSVDLTIGSGQLVYWYIHYYATFADGDIRFRADSNPGAGHRHTGVFMDW